MSELVLSPDQERALEEILDWLCESNQQTLSVGGYAGTGKSTLISHLVNLLGAEEVSVCAYTGKAASVLRSKGVDASTLHRLIYEPKLRCRLCDGDAHLEGCPRCETTAYLKLEFRRIPQLPTPLVIVDEASMLSARLVDDLLGYGIKVLYVGDHGQLEPIGDDPGVMREPTIRLEEIHRQAKGSEIIRFAHHLREGGEPRDWDSTGDVRVSRGLTGVNFMYYDVVLCGFNRTRVAVNKKIREHQGRSGGDPVPGDRLICLRNDYELGVFNGMLVTVTNVRDSDDDFIRLDFCNDAGELYMRVPIARRYLGTGKKSEWASAGVGQFDWGYCLTAHKSQGAEFGKVAVLEQLCDLWSSRRWRYTAATRASRELHYYLSTRNGR